MIFPKGGRINAGITITLYCNTSAVWYFSGQKTIPENPTPVINSDRLKIEYISMTNNGYYFCFGAYQGSSLHFLAKVELQVFYGMLTLMLNVLIVVVDVEACIFLFLSLLYYLLLKIYTWLDLEWFLLCNG